MTRKLKRASDLYESFTGHDAALVDEVELKDYDVAIVIGDLDAVEYTTVRDGKTEPYRHQFKHKCRPLLCVSEDGQQLMIIKGRYLFTESGIEDQ